MNYLSSINGGCVYPICSKHFGQQKSIIKLLSLMSSILSSFPNPYQPQEGYKIFDIKDEELKEHKVYEDIKLSLDVFKQYNALSTKIEITQTVEDEW